MAYGILLVDDQGNPIPQVIDAATNTPAPLYAEKGAIRARSVEADENGVFKIAIMSKDNKKVAINENYIPVNLVSPAMNNYVFDGTSWIPEMKTVAQEICALAEVSGASRDSIQIANPGCANLLVYLNIVTAGTTISKVSVQALFGTDYMEVCSATVSLGAGKHLVSFGRDAIDNKGIIPNTFKIVFTHAGTQVMKYSVNIQLV